MTEFTIREFLDELERTAGAAAQNEQALLDAEVNLTQPRFSANQIAQGSARIARRVQALRAKAQQVRSRPVQQPQPATPKPSQPSRPPVRAAGPKFCTKCGAQRQPGKRFCAKCGAQY